MNDSMDTVKDLPETGITPGGTTGAFRDVLSKDHARRGKPPLHFADMSEDERIAKAKELIAQGDLTLNAIAEQVGFGNIKTFRRTFQKIENMNPSDYELSSDADQE